MAKKPLEIFRKTEGDLDAGNIKAIGVGLPEGEIAALDDIAAALEVKRNKLMRFIVRSFILRYRAGKVDLSQFTRQAPPPPKDLPLPTESDLDNL